jgi:hypothetical protein
MQKMSVRYNQLKIGTWDCLKNAYYVGFEVLTWVIMKNFIFCDIMPFRSLNVGQYFRGTYASVFRVEE